MDFIAYSEGKKYFIKNKNISENLDIGKIERKDLIKAKNGDKVTTSIGKEVTLITPSFIDEYKGMKRGAQAINRKDCAAILGETMVGKDAICFDCGSGMGGLTCFLARYVKKVYSMDYVSEHLKKSKQNAEMLGLKNIEFLGGDIYEGIPVKKKFDMITLDLINPEKIVDDAKKRLKPGGFVVAYCPQTTQMEVFVNEAREKNLEIVKVLEVGERRWKVEGKICRPEHMGLMHTGFLCFIRKLF